MINDASVFVITTTGAANSCMCGVVGTYVKLQNVDPPTFKNWEKSLTVVFENDKWKFSGVQEALTVAGTWAWPEWKGDKWECHQCNFPTTYNIKILLKEESSYAKTVLDNISHDTGNSDLKIRLRDGTDISAHRAVIASSCPAWRGLLASGCLSSQEGIIQLDDVEPQAARAFVRALYTGDVESPSEALKVLQLADRYRAAALIDILVHGVIMALEDSQDTGLTFQAIETIRKCPGLSYKAELRDAVGRVLSKQSKEDLQRSVFGS